MSSVIDWTVSKMAVDMPPWHKPQPPRRATKSIDLVADLLHSEGRPMTTREIAEALGVTRDTINIACRRLELHGVLTHSDGPQAANNHFVPIWRLK